VEGKCHQIKTDSNSHSHTTHTTHTRSILMSIWCEGVNDHLQVYPRLSFTSRRQLSQLFTSRTRKEGRKGRSNGIQIISERQVILLFILFNRECISLKKNVFLFAFVFRCITAIMIAISMHSLPVSCLHLPLLSCLDMACKWEEVLHYRGRKSERFMITL